MAEAKAKTRTVTEGMTLTLSREEAVYLRNLLERVPSWSDGDGYIAEEISYALAAAGVSLAGDFSLEGCQEACVIFSCVKDDE